MSDLPNKPEQGRLFDRGFSSGVEYPVEDGGFSKPDNQPTKKSGWYVDIGLRANMLDLTISGLLSANRRHGLNKATSSEVMSQEIIERYGANTKFVVGSSNEKIQDDIKEAKKAFAIAWGLNGASGSGLIGIDEAKRAIRDDFYSLNSEVVGPNNLNKRNRIRRRLKKQATRIDEAKNK